MNNLCLFTFDITASSPVSQAFIARNIHTFQDAMKFITQLPYGRNANKKDLISVFADGCGTCSTKHAILKQLAIENNIIEVKLILGIFKMNKENTRAITNTLEKYNLSCMPEAHNYLRIENEIVDCTNINLSVSDLEKSLITEIEIQPEQITDFKVNYHKTFLAKWLGENKNINYSLDEFFEIREQCILDLSNNNK